MSHGNGGSALDCPLTAPAALAAPDAMTERLVDEMTAHGHPAGLQAAVGYDQREIATAHRELRRIEGLVVGSLRDVPVRW